MTGPALFLYALAYRLRKPEAPDAGDAWVIVLASVMVTLATQVYGAKRADRIKDTGQKREFLVARFGGLAGGLAFFFMFYFLILRP